MAKKTVRRPATVKPTGPVTTLALGEEGPTHTTLVVGEEGTTHLLGEEGHGQPPVTTLPVGEEGVYTTHLLGEEGHGQPPTTFLLGEEGHGLPPSIPIGEINPTQLAGEVFPHDPRGPVEKPPKPAGRGKGRK